MTHAVVLLSILLQWVIAPFTNNEWVITMLLQYITIAILFSYILNLISNKSLLIRSLFALFALDAWCDVVKFGLWQFSDYEIDLSLVGIIIFILWFIFTLKRQYPDMIDLIDMDNVNLLILKPRTSFEVLKGLIGYPAASICIVTSNFVWCYRKKTNIFEMTPYSPEILKNHLVIDTKCKSNDYLISALNSLIGTKRFPCIKCVWTIRKVLNIVGGKYAIKTWFDYMPGIYFMRII